MSALSDYFERKKTAVAARKERLAAGELKPKQVRAETTLVTVGDPVQIGVRRSVIRGHQLVTDSGPELGGTDLGPSPVELLLASLGGCLAHTFMIQAAVRDIPITALDVDVTATVNPLAGQPGIPVHPTDFSYSLRIESSAPTDEIEAAYEAAERACPVTAALTQPVPVAGKLQIVQAASIAS
jgi:uncharacterized OsmC-like protein